MVDSVNVLANSFLSLSAQDLRELTDWPEPLIEDYLSILRNLLALATIVDVDIEGGISDNAGQIQLALSKLSSVQKQIADLEGSASANSALIFQAIGKLTGLNKGLDDIEGQGSSDYSASLVTNFSVFGAPPAIGTIRMSPGYFSRGGIGTNTLRDDINSVQPDWQVEGPAASLSVVRNSNDSSGADIYLGKTRATENGGVTIVQDGDLIGRLLFVAADGSDLDTISGAITLTVDDGSPSAGSVGATLGHQVMTAAGVLTTVVQVDSSLAHDYTIGDNLAVAYAVSGPSGNDYIQIVTTNASEAMNFGNVTTNPSYNFLGSGSVSAAVLVDNSTILITSGSALVDNAGAGAGTLANAPTAGDPSKWVEINDNGTSRYVPTWT